MDSAPGHKRVALLQKRAALRRKRPAPPRGAAILLAMVILTVVSTLAASMVWQQWRSVHVEAAERSRTQSGWILLGALDWARLILREQRGNHISLNDAWAQPLAEARLSTFLAADRDNNSDSGPEAFLSGQISDAQSRYNLRNLVVADQALAAAELKVLERLCQAAGLSSSVAAAIAQGLTSATLGKDGPLMPTRLDDLRWLGVDGASIDALRPWVALLPDSGTKVNVNTAPREVLAAVIEGIDSGGAERLVQARLRQPFRNLEEAKAQFGAKLLGDEKALPLALQRVDVTSAFFEVRGRLRLDDRVLEEISLVHKTGPSDVVTRQRQRLSLALLAGGT